MIFAIIDLGTNTFNLLIAKRLPNNTFEKIFNTKIAVKLGEDTINKGYIADVAFERGIDALKQYQNYLLDYNVEHTYAFATSAIRSAINGQDFVTEAEKLTGISISVIDGAEEAELIYYGNRMAVNLTDDVSLIMDIGGGSTELILANKTTILWKYSFLLGAARLLEKCKLSDPCTQKEMDDFNFYIKEELSLLFEAAKIHKPVELVGSSGAFDSVVDMISNQFKHPILNDETTEYSINIDHYKAISEKIKITTIKDRYLIDGLIDMRVDMIVISILLIDFIMREFNLSAMRVSTFSLKEGVISKKLGLSHS